MKNINLENQAAYEAIAEEFENHPDFLEAREVVEDFSALNADMLREIDASIDHYEKTGLHITLDEVKQWAQALKTNRSAELPKCHT